MYCLSLACFFLVLSTIVLDWRRLRELAPAAMAGALHTGLYAALPIRSMQYGYTDTGPITNNWALVLIAQFVIASVLAAWYAQGVGPDPRPPVVRTLQFSLLTSCLAWMAMVNGTLVLAEGVPLWLLPLGALWHFLVVWKIYHYVAFGSPDRKGDRSVRMR